MAKPKQAPPVSTKSAEQVMAELLASAEARAKAVKPENFARLTRADGAQVTLHGKAYAHTYAVRAMASTPQTFAFSEGSSRVDRFVVEADPTHVVKTLVFIRRGDSSVADLSIVPVRKDGALRFNLAQHTTIGLNDSGREYCTRYSEFQRARGFVLASEAAAPSAPESLYSRFRSALRKYFHREVKAFLKRLSYS